VDGSSAGSLRESLERIALEQRMKNAQLAEAALADGGVPFAAEAVELLATMPMKVRRCPCACPHADDPSLVTVQPTPLTKLVVACSARVRPAACCPFGCRPLPCRLHQPAQYVAAGMLPQEQWKHYALAIPYYTHFTSPIRRYADVLVHRVLTATLDHAAIDHSPSAPAAAPLPRALLKLSMDELGARAERCNEKKAAAKAAQEQVGGGGM
jgi:hypothetical protein